MISFDDYGGGDGSSVNLSPIYNSISSLSSNSQTFYNAFTYYTYNNTGSGGSSPYMKGYVSLDGDYQYNISGDVLMENLLYSTLSDTCIIKGNLGMLSQSSTAGKSYNFSHFDIDHAKTIKSLRERGSYINLNANSILYNLIYNYDYDKLIASFMESNTISGVVNDMIFYTAKANTLVNHINNMNGFYFSKNKVSTSNSYLVYMFNASVGEINENTISSVCNLCCNFKYGGFNSISSIKNVCCTGAIFTKNTISSIELGHINGNTIYSNNFSNWNYGDINAVSFNSNTFKISIGTLNNMMMMSNSGSVYVGNINASEMKTTNKLYMCEGNLNAMVISENSLTFQGKVDVKAYRFSNNVVYSGCVDMNMVLGSANMFSYMTELNLTAHTLEVSNTFKSINKLHLDYYSNNNYQSFSKITSLYMPDYVPSSVMTYDSVDKFFIENIETLFDSNMSYTGEQPINKMYAQHVPFSMLKNNGGGVAQPYMKSYNSTDGNYQYNLSGSYHSQTLNLNNSLNYLYGIWNVKDCSFSSKAGVLDLKCVEFATNTFDTVDYLTINTPGGVIGKNQFKDISSLSFNGMFVNNSITKVNNMEGRGMMFMYNNITGDLVKFNNGIVANNTLNGLNYNLNNCFTVAENEFNISSVLNINAYNSIIANKFNGSFVSNDFNKGTLNITCYNTDLLMNTMEKWNLININNGHCKFNNCDITNNDIVNITAGGIDNSGTITYSNIKTLNLLVSGTISNAIFENIDYLNISAASLEKCTFRSLKTCDLFEVSGINVSNNNCDFSSIISLKYPLLHPDSISIDMYNGTQGTLPGDSIISINFKNVGYALIGDIKASSYTNFVESNWFWGRVSDCYWNGVNMMAFKN